ncbi:hypothetical protein, partial [Desulfitobacterium hafniense]|uniref:hypothetical protein n=1 Tax=Desulfitobacterium hafniense TaxID=49338 RepID=UPI001A981F20
RVDQPWSYGVSVVRKATRPGRPGQIGQIRQTSNCFPSSADAAPLGTNTRPKIYAIKELSLTR